MAGSASKGQAAGTGTIVSIGSLTGSAGTENFLPVGEVSDAKFSGRKLGTVSTTNFDSGGIARKLSTITDYGQVTLTVLRVSNDAGQQGVVAANAAGGAYDFKVQLPVNTKAGQVATGDLITFSAIVTQADFDVSLTKASEWSFTLDIDGAYTVVAGS